MGKCKWIYLGNYHSDFWDTLCGNEHIFLEGGPIENFHKYCPYCGREIEEEADNES